MTVFSFSDSAC